MKEVKMGEFGSSRHDHMRTLEIIARFMAIKKVRHLRGSIAQVGVGNGFGLVTYATMHDVLSSHQTGTLFFGFDTFTFYPNPENDEQAAVTKLANSVDMRWEGNLLEKTEQRIANYESFAPFPSRASGRFRLIVGPVEETLVNFRPGASRFKLVEIDVNLRAGTRSAITYFWPLLVPGGIMVFGGYSQNDWPGETEEVHQFLVREKLRPKTFRVSSYPSSYCRKPWIS